MGSAATSAAVSPFRPHFARSVAFDLLTDGSEPSCANTCPCRWNTTFLKANRDCAARYPDDAAWHAGDVFHATMKDPDFLAEKLARRPAISGCRQSTAPQSKALIKEICASYRADPSSRLRTMQARSRDFLSAPRGDAQGERATQSAVEGAVWRVGWICPTGLPLSCPAKTGSQRFECHHFGNGDRTGAAASSRKTLSHLAKRPRMTLWPVH